MCYTWDDFSPGRLLSLRKNLTNNSWHQQENFQLTIDLAHTSAIVCDSGLGLWRAVPATTTARDREIWNISTRSVLLVKKKWCFRNQSIIIFGNILTTLTVGPQTICQDLPSQQDWMQALTGWNGGCVLHISLPFNSFLCTTPLQPSWSQTPDSRLCDIFLNKINLASW